MPSDYSANPLYLHPLLHTTLPGILSAVTAALPTGWKAGTGSQSIHRTPNEQFEIYKHGRTFKNGTWVKTGTTYTGKDGFKNKSRHNFLPATAVDIILTRPDGTVLDAGPQEQKIKKGAQKYGFEWGGDWTGFQDLPHIQLPLGMLFKNDLVRDEALQWQKYLFHAGVLGPVSELDGAWGDHSKAALLKVTGSADRTPATWLKLYQKFGPLQNLPDFTAISWIPKVTVA